VDLNRCIGCGICVPTCKTGAISLQKKPTETRPPETRDELFNIFMTWETYQQPCRNINSNFFIFF
jgi:ferredoxin